jgi:hypothetical protein
MAHQHDQRTPGNSIHQVIEQGRVHLGRRRLLRLAGTPLLAATAALAVALTGAAAWATSGHVSPSGRSGTFAPGTFNPSRLTIGFGWLPRGSLVLEGLTSAGSEQLWVSSPHNRQWAFADYARNACHVSATKGFHCVQAVRGGPVSMGSKNPVTARGPGINGHPSFWLGSEALAWEHGPGEWAVVNDGNGVAATTVRIARGAKFGIRAVPAKYGQRVPLLYGVRFTSLPHGWRLIRLDFGRAGLHGVPGRHLYEAGDFTLAKVRRLTATTEAATDAPMISFAPDHSANDCVIPKVPGRHVRTRHLSIHGYRFILARFGTGRLSFQILCGSPIDGLAVSITEEGAHEQFPPTKVMERLQLLGPNPASWTTNPLP